MPYIKDCGDVRLTGDFASTANDNADDIIDATVDVNGTGIVVAADTPSNSLLENTEQQSTQGCVVVDESTVDEVHIEF